MRAWKSIAMAIVGLVIIANWIATRDGSLLPVSSPAPGNVEPTELPSPPVATIPKDEPPAVPDHVPAPSPAPAFPKPRNEESRAASRRDLENPLVVSYPPSTPPPRRAADSDPEITADFDKVSLMLRDYRTLAGENPVGTNAEIMKSIMGGNPKGAQLGPPDGQNVNAEGELLDRWGTPYFFHQLSKDLMEIHSAGPDRHLWNEDDIVGD